MEIEQNWFLGCVGYDITNLKKKVVIPLTLVYGKGKPKDLNFLEDTVTALNDLIINGILNSQVVVNQFICDAPAKSYVLGIKQFNGERGCGRCNVKGTKLNNVMTFPSEIIAEYRTDAMYRTFQDNNQLPNVRTPLMNIYNLDMILDFVFDSMHLVYTGVVKKMCKVWIHGNVTFSKLSDIIIENVSEEMEELVKYLPRKLFARLPKPLKECDQWKASEGRVFLLYLGVFALRVQDFPPELFKNFQCLFVAISILENNKLSRDPGTLEYARTLLKTFFKQCRVLYGQDFLSYNLHGLLHLTEDVKRFGTLTENSAFPFESFNINFSNSIRARAKPLTEFAKRYFERIDLTFFWTKDVVYDGSCFIYDRNCIEIVSVNSNLAHCRVYQGIDSYFTYPCDARLINWIRCSCNFQNISLDKNILTEQQQSLKFKDGNNLIFVPILHTGLY